MKIRPLLDEFLRAEGHTDMTVLTNTFCNFTNGPQMGRTVYPTHFTPLFIDLDITDFIFHTWYKKLFFIFLYVDISVVYVCT
jgi:hypothetical protein